MEKNGDDGGGMGAPGTARRSFEQYVASFAAGEEPEWTKLEAARQTAAREAREEAARVEAVRPD